MPVPMCSGTYSLTSCVGSWFLAINPNQCKYYRIEASINLITTDIPDGTALGSRMRLCVDLHLCVAGAKHGVGVG